MTPLPTYDRRHPAPVVPVERTSPGPSIFRHRRRPIALTGALILVAALIGGASVFAWDRIGSRDQNDALASAIDAREEALATAATLSERVDGLQDGLARARARATNLEGDLAAAQAELLTMLGPALPDGKHFGEIYAVGPNQNPPRLVIDIEQWFTDQAAFDAAEEDGVFLDHPYYIRNESPRWRTIEIDPSTRVSLEPFRRAGYEFVSPPTVSLSRFGELYYSYEGDFFRYSPFWITVDDGKIVAIEGQFIS